MTFRSNKKAAFAFSALAIGVAGIAVQAQAATATQIQGMTVSQPSANITQIRLNFDGTPVAPVAYQQAGSNQLVLDFNKVGSAALPRNMAVNTGIINDVVALSNGNLTRLMVNLKSAATYSSKVEGNQLVLDVVDTGVSSSIKEATSTPQVVQVQVNPLLNPANAQKSRGNYDGVSGINYSANPAGGGTINIALTNEAIPVDVQRQGNKIVVRTTGATLPRHLVRRLNAGGLVANIDATNQGQNGVMTINMSGDYEYQAYQSGSQLTIKVSPPELLREPTLEEKVYTGEPLSLEFQDVPVRTVLDVLARFTNQNITASDSVTGNITLRLVNVPWDQALDIILQSKNLDKRVNGSVIVVDRAEILAKQDADRLKAAAEVKDLSPLRTEYIRLSYANAQKVFDMIQNAATNNNNGNSNNNRSGLLTARGSVIVDTRTNTLIVKDTSESINSLRSMLEKIDIPVSQVMVEARIVTASDTFSKEMGVRWGIAHDSVHGSRRFQAGGSERAMWDIREGRDTITFQDNSTIAVDLGVSNPVGRLAFGLLNISDTLLDLELSAMQADQRGEVISSPKVLTSNNQKARILSGDKIPFQESALNGNTTLTWIDAALVLEVTPNITPDGKIGLTLMVSNGATTTAPNGALAVKEDSIDTNVVLEDGQTVVLGGVFRNTVNQGVTKVPFLGDLPYVGRLFKNDIRRNDKQELLIFITPKIVNDGVSRIQ